VIALAGAALLLAQGATASARAAAAESERGSEAQTAPFMTEYVADLRVPSSLRYGLVKRGTLQAGFSDTVEVEVRASADAGRSVVTGCLSGGRKLELFALDFAQGNPALSRFIERDIGEMERLTGGKSAYFRKRIRLVLAERAQIKPTSFSYNGHPVAGREICISPYQDDPLRSRFERYADKASLCKVSNEVPGELIEADAMIPAGSGGQGSEAGRLLEEVLTLTGSNSQKAKQ
jgi:hypothetical protein